MHTQSLSHRQPHTLTLALIDAYKYTHKDIQIYTQAHTNRHIPTNTKTYS